MMKTGISNIIMAVEVLQGIGQAMRQFHLVYIHLEQKSQWRQISLSQK